ncbi:MAG: hypothetical protein PUF59_09805, partial [Lachnospiraceae bacterium]|nr:hypothetical protein [Lachnospiraceae bacterium]
KDLAAILETRTGKPMSRQNLTQKLNRNNFQEQDMKEIAAALGCGLVIQLIPPIHSDPTLPSVESILAAAQLPVTPEPVAAASVPVAPAPASAPDPETHPLPAAAAPEQTPTVTVSSVQPEDIPSEQPQASASYYIEEREPDKESLSKQMSALFNPLLHTERKKRPERSDSILSLLSGSRKNHTEESSDSSHTAAHSEDAHFGLPADCINRLTGEEYLTNTVRRVPGKEGFIQVYDASDHTWTETNESEFLRFQQQKKQMLGSDYEPPIYI